MWRGLYHDHWLLGAHKDTMPRRKWLKPFNFHIFLRRFLSTFLVFALISLSFPIASLSFQDETSEPTYEELMTIFGEEDTSYLTTDDAAWDALLGVMKNGQTFLSTMLTTLLNTLGYSVCEPSENSSPCAPSLKQVWSSVKEVKQSTLTKSAKPLTKRLGQPWSN